MRSIASYRVILGQFGGQLFEYCTVQVSLMSILAPRDAYSCSYALEWPVVAGIV
jgi:hypothetical protein